jgi:hypothetical protein
MNLQLRMVSKRLDLQVEQMKILCKIKMISLGETAGRMIAASDILIGDMNFMFLEQINAFVSFLLRITLCRLEELLWSLIGTSKVSNTCRKMNVVSVRRDLHPRLLLYHLKRSCVVIPTMLVVWIRKA